MKHTLSILVENKFGVLARVAGLFSARGYNIDSLAVSETQDSTISRMTIVVNAEDEKILEQIKKQLHKLIDVVTVVDFMKKDFIERELVFIKIHTADIKKSAAGKKKIASLKKAIKKFSAEVIEKKSDSFVLQLVSDQEHIKEFLSAIKEFKVAELVRTGRIAILK